MEFETLLLEVRDSVAHLTLNRPDAANAINRQLALDLLQAAIACDEDARVRCVLITGAGKMFCAGGDLKSFAAQGDGLPAHLKELTAYLHAAISRFVWMDAPVIAAVNGPAGGAGLSLVCATDLAIAAASAKFVMAYTRAGLAPDGSSTYFLSKLIGMRRAKELALTNRALSAEEALEWGLINRVVPDAELAAAAGELAASLAEGATMALGEAKRLIQQGFTESLESQMERETRGIADLARTEDAREGMAAFIAKRKPDFKGR